MKRTLTRIAASVAMMATAVACAETTQTAEPYADDWESLKKHKATPEWFADAKLGVYFHWGVYSVPAWGTEWYPRFMYMPDRDKGWGHDIYEYHVETYGKDFHYHDFIDMWDGAPKFSASQWLDMFEGMGAKFVGSIAEHHDGFSMWDSTVNEWNSVDMGPKINVVDSIATETRKRGLKFMATFHHGFNHIFFPKNKKDAPEQIMPVWESEEEKDKYVITYDKTLVPQDPKYKKLYGTMSYDDANDLWLAKLDEVIEEFCPDYIWMDFGQRYIKDEYRRKFLQHYFNKAQEMGVDAVVNTKGEFFPRELAVVNVERATMADITPDVWITDFILGSNWCFNRAKRNAIDPKMAIKMLADVVSKNGVMLLSAGPMADGTIPEEQVEAMEGIGRWMQPYGEAIYGTRPFVEYGQGTTKLTGDPADEWNEYGAIKYGFNKLCAEDIRYTMDKKKNIVYALQLGWAKEGISHDLTAFSPASKLRVKSVSVLGSDEAIEWSMSDKGLSIKQPKAMPAEGDAATVYKIQLAK
ncbi:MAG: alpha-L-fucosidase [Rikenellaceae bacterium]